MRSSGRRSRCRGRSIPRRKRPDAGLQWKGTRSTKSLGQHMSHDYTLTDDDAAPADATHAQDILELSMLTMPQPGAPIVDISWEKSPLDL